MVTQADEEIKKEAKAKKARAAKPMGDLRPMEKSLDFIDKLLQVSQSNSNFPLSDSMDKLLQETEEEERAKRKERKKRVADKARATKKERARKKDFMRDIAVMAQVGGEIVAQQGGDFLPQKSSRKLSQKFFPTGKCS